jgi:DNA-binding GntR family transcriptional regulator
LSSSTEGILTVERMNTRTLKDQVAHLVSVAILSGKIKAGERLNESKLARDLGVSRIPIREALQELQERGLVVNMPRRGKFVISLSDEEIQKINSLRLILEAEALRLCRAKINPEGVQSLRSVIEKMGQSGELPEIEAAALDLEFHRTVWRYSDNEYLARSLETITVPLFAHRVLWRINQEMLGWAAILANHHRALLNFVLGRNQSSAEDVMLEHLSYRYTHPERFSSLALRPSHAVAAAHS